VIINPNTTKFRIPAIKEGNFLRELIRKEEKELTELEDKITAAQKDVDDQKLAVQKYESILGLAKHLGASAESTIAAINQSDNIAPLVNAPFNDTTPPTVQLPTSSQEATLGWNDLLANGAELLRIAESTKQASIQRTRDAEREVESGQSVLYFLNETLVSLLHIKQKAEEKILKMKDVISSRRRIPDEVWLQIFTERVIEDEEPYTHMDLEGPPPFTTLRLTWVCRLWRTIIIEHPALWRYIAIPLVEYPTQQQWDRIRYLKNRLGSISPYVYTVSGTQIGTYKGDTFVHLVKEFACFERLKIYANRPFMPHLFGSLQPNTQEFIIIGKRQEEGGPDIAWNVSSFLENIRSLRTINALLHTGTSSHLQTVHLSLRSIHPVSIMTFLDTVTSLTTLSISIISPVGYCQETGAPQITLANLVSLSCDIVCLGFIFRPNIHLPKLKNLSLVGVLYYKDDASNEYVRQWWDDFISVDQRRDAISSLILLATCSPLWQANTAGRCDYIINSLPNIKSLTLEDSTVVPALDGLSKHIPQSLLQLTIANSDQVEEHHLEEFITSLYEQKVEVFSLQIDNCALISEERKERLSLLIANLPKQNQ
jgi:hypothetical protein